VAREVLGVVLDPSDRAVELDRELEVAGVVGEVK
jgi:hypothetical protein